MIAIADEPFASDAARQAFVDELSDMLSMYLLVPRPWRQQR
jgi:hypothetical protein